MSIGSFLKRLFGGGGGSGDGPPRFERVETDLSSYTTTVDGVKAAAIGDDFVAAWGASDFAGGEPRKVKTRRLKIALSRAARGKSVRLYLHGYQPWATAPVGKVTAQVGAHSYDVPLPLEESSPFKFEQEVQLAAHAMTLDVVIEIALPRPSVEGLERSIAIDALDLQLVA